MSSGILKIATCQFAVGGDSGVNARQVRSYMKQAKRRGADVVHFCESALSGYAGTDFESFADYDWDKLRAETEGVMRLAGELGLWVIVGSAHRLTAPNKPHNCLYLIGPKGDLVSRYDKRFCMDREMPHYTPGNRAVSFTVNNVRCSLLVCFDLRFPELYRELKKDGVECVFQSFYNARQEGPSVHKEIMRQTMQARAATNYFWVSMANSSARYSPYPSCFIRPDGKIVKQLKMNSPGMMVNTVDTGKEFYDPMLEYRSAAMAGRLTNGPVDLKDPRSVDTTRL